MTPTNVDVGTWTPSSVRPRRAAMAKKITQQMYNLTTRLEGARTKKAFALDVQKVMEARRLEMDHFRKLGVYNNAPLQKVLGRWTKAYQHPLA